MRLLSLVLAFALPPIAPIVAQPASPAPANATCEINTTPPNEADIAFWKGELQKANSLYGGILAKDPSASLSRVRQIQALLDQRKISEASKLTDAWTATSPTDAYAVGAVGSVRLAEGDMVEGYAILAKAAKLNPCLAFVYERMALFEDLAGYHAASSKHLALGHQLDPLDDRLKIAWIGSLPRTEQFSQIEQYLSTSKSLDDKRRASLKASFERRRALEKDDCRLVSTASTVTIPMTPIGSGAGIDSYGLEIAFNGKKRILQIDTGASGMTLTLSASTGLGLTRVDAARIGGVGDQEHYLGAAIDEAASVKIGGAEFRNCPVSVFANFGVMGGDADFGGKLDESEGLVGTDIFARYLVTLDYVRHEIRLEPLPKRPDDNTPADRLDALGAHLDPDPTPHDKYVAPSMQSWAKIYRSGHDLLMPTRIGSAGAKLFLIDTGAFTSIISPEAAREVTNTKEDLEYVGGLSGRVKKEFVTGKFTMDFAGIRVPVRSMASVDMGAISDYAGVAISGFIGYPVLS